MLLLLWYGYVIAAAVGLLPVVNTVAAYQVESDDGDDGTTE